MDTDTKILFKSVFDSAADGILLCDSTLAILEVNKSFLKLTGLDYNKVTNTHIPDLIKELLPSLYYSQMKLVMGCIRQLYKGDNCRFELRYRGKMFSVSIGPCPEGGCYTVIFRDVTENRRMLKQLKYSEDKYKTLIESSNDSIFVIQQGIIRYVNSELKRLSGLADHELIGKPFIEFVAPEERQKIGEFYKKRLSGEDSPEKYNSIAQIGNDLRYEVEVSVIPISYNGTASEQVILRDVSREHKALREVSEREENFRLLAENCFDGIFINDQKGNYLYANKRAAEISGYTVDELIKMNARQLSPQSLHSKLKTSIDSQFTDHQELVNIDFTLLHKDGIEVPIEVSASRTKWQGKNAQIVAVRDVTRRKKYEGQIKESEQKLRTLFNVMKDVVIELDTEGRYVFIAPTSPDLFYRPADYMLGKKLHDVFPKKQADDFLSAIQTSIQKNKLVTYEYSLEIGEKKVWFEGRISPKSRNTVLFIAHDVTEEKKIKDALAASEAKYREIIEFAPIGFYQSDRKGKFLFVNNDLAAILGYESREELYKLNIRDLYFNPSEREALINKFDTRSFGKVKNQEVNFRAKDGSSLWVLMTARAIRKENGSTEYYDGFIIDITDKRKKERIQHFLFGVSMLSLKDISLGDYLKSIHEELKKLVSADNFYIALYNKEKDVYTFPFHQDLYDRISKTDEVNLDNTLTDYVRKTGRAAMITEKDEKKLREEEHIVLYGEPSPVWLGAPLMDAADNEVIGVIAMQDYEREDAYNIEDLITLEIVANNIGQFINRVQNLAMLKKEKDKALEGEQRYKSMFNDNSSVMLLIDPDTGGIFDANKAACDFYGYDYEQLISMNINEINVTDYEDVSLDIKRARDGEKKHFNFIHKLADGSLRNVEVYSGNILHKGKPLLYSIIHDISERKKAQEEIQRLSKALDQSPTPVALTNLDGIFVYVNPSFCKLSEYSPEELIGKHTRMMRSGKQKKAFYKDLWDTIRSGNTWEGELVNKKKSGKFYLEEVSIAPVINEKGEMTNFVKVARDITEERQLRDELVEAKEKAEESDSLKSAFLANMSHEIRTPMNGILGFTDLLKEVDLSETKQRQYLEIIEKSGERMLNTVNNLIEISRIEAGQIGMLMTAFNINEECRELYLFFKSEVERKGIKLILNTPLDDKDAVIESDKQKFISILTNLIKNAIKYTEEGFIEFGYCLNNGIYEFCIRDTGIGIPASRQKAIFNRFIQADLTDKRALQGSGLGLSIVKAYVEMLGGMIRMESFEGKGSSFWFTLPED